MCLAGSLGGERSEKGRAGVWEGSERGQSTVCCRQVEREIWGDTGRYTLQVERQVERERVLRRRHPELRVRPRVRKRARKVLVLQRDRRQEDMADGACGTCQGHVEDVSLRRRQEDMADGAGGRLDLGEQAQALLPHHPRD